MRTAISNKMGTSINLILNIKIDRIRTDIRAIYDFPC